MENNLTFLERFNADLSNWTLSLTGGTVAIVEKDFSPKLELNDTSAAANVSATRSFVEPAGKWILEYDINHEANSAGVMELLDASDNPIITVSLGLTANTLSFSTDVAGASTATFNAGVYKQVILAIDNPGNTVKCWLSNDDATYGALVEVAGGAKAYSGASIAKIRFRTDNTKTGKVWLDEIKIFTPKLFMIGDSITDGKLYWSTHPAYNQVSKGRLWSGEDETSPPHYHLQNLLNSNLWVANRAFGGSRTDQVDAAIQSTVLDQWPGKVYIAVGHNDIVQGIALATMQANMDSILAKVQAAGITGTNIILANVFPGVDIDTSTERQKRTDWNAWLLARAAAIGAVFIDLDAVMADPADPNAIRAEYHDGQGVHLNSAGSFRLAYTVYKGIIANGAVKPKHFLAHDQTGKNLYLTMARVADDYLLDDADGEFRTKVIDFYKPMYEHPDLKGRYETFEARRTWADGRYLVQAYRQAGATPDPSIDKLAAKGVMIIKDDSEVYMDVPVSSRADGASYTSARAAKLDNLDATIASRLSAAVYAAPDNASITAIKSKTDNLPADPASNTQVNTRASQASVDAIPTDPLRVGDYVLPDNAALSFIQKWVLNRLAVTDNEVKLYDDDDVTILKSWSWDDATRTRHKAQ